MERPRPSSALSTPLSARRSKSPTKAFLPMFRANSPTLSPNSSSGSSAVTFSPSISTRCTRSMSKDALPATRRSGQQQTLSTNAPSNLRSSSSSASQKHIHRHDASARKDDQNLTWRFAESSSPANSPQPLRAEKQRSVSYSYRYRQGQDSTTGTDSPEQEQRRLIATIGLFRAENERK
mmetsp:Transcript_46842/g.118044  ORF Transcript_46842/g.118044 Transcript_46842/m.118044 type:complete len:179 (+) Transcript_46842:70-606(+)|eukprot:CAMPEP_0177667556 /NCGR_PEP_ID=MMETSP0447-20121125/22186_1 /TAXON_ID=0 /ORGANISM="Stygamoeba regulata, Strain BSH-02190019" /LENGTH=178 /DNA_ID=CAMNT_0019173795 /DNA_START=178 /DNA_END=714 /DNA_ORIENTATION=+